MRHHTAPAFCASALLACTGTALAGGTGGGQPGTIVDGESSYTYFGSGTNGRAAWIPGGDVTGSQLFESWWYYRANGVEPDGVTQTREYAFAQGVPNSTVYDGNTATFSGDESDANVQQGDDAAQLSWVMTWAIEDGMFDTLSSTMTVTNEGNETLALEMFHYGDINLNGNATDSAIVDDDATIVIGDALTPGVTINYAANGADAFQIEVRDNLLQLLNDASATEFADENNVTSPADLTGGFQWSGIELLPGESRTFSVGFTVVPAPGAGMLLGLAAIGATRRRRG
ncbi:MAG: PEP-CTERM sorting domain-containing protein [Planctomycetota bacterium]